MLLAGKGAPPPQAVLVQIRGMCSELLLVSGNGNKDLQTRPPSCYPTSARSIRFWYHRRKSDTHWQCICEQRSYQMDFPGFDVDTARANQVYECQDCQMERFRRKRVLDVKKPTAWEKNILNDDKFKTCILITPFNRSVFHFGLQRALNLAASMSAPLFWMQAIDTPPSWYSNGFSKD